MVERESNPQFIDMVSLFGEKLAQWDKRIVEIIAVGDLVKDTPPLDKAIQLVCILNPEPTDSSVGFFSILNLLMRDDYEHVSERLGITNPINLGFKMDGKVYLPNSVILDSIDEQTVIWPQYNKCEPADKNPSQS